MIRATNQPIEIVSRLSPTAPDWVFGVVIGIYAFFYMLFVASVVLGILDGSDEKDIFLLSGCPP